MKSAIFSLAMIVLAGCSTIKATPAHFPHGTEGYFVNCNWPASGDIDDCPDGYFFKLCPHGFAFNKAIVPEDLIPDGTFPIECHKEFDGRKLK